MDSIEGGGLAKLRQWVETGDGKWSAEPATGGKFRLLYDDRKILYAYDTRAGISGFVDCALPGDMDVLSRFGFSRSGYNHQRRGAHFAFRDFDGFLRWCADMIPSRRGSLSPLDRSRTGPRS